MRAIDDRTIAFPYYDGNGMYLSMGGVMRANQEIRWVRFPQEISLKIRHKYLC